MKILAFSDLHNDQESGREIVRASKTADVVVGAGDFGVKGASAADVLQVLRQIEVPTIFVAGNHDNLDELQAFCAEWEKGHFLHGTPVMIQGRPFFGLGCEIPSRSDYSWNQTLTEKEAEALLVHCPDQAVLVTHTPPLGYCDLQRDGGHEGSQAILDAIVARNIKLNLCGHIHHSWGTVAQANDCIVHNLGPTVNWYDLAQE
jgi:Icc-related predicted phosphoesterase